MTKINTNTIKTASDTVRKAGKKAHDTALDLILRGLGLSIVFGGIFGFIMDNEPPAVANASDFTPHEAIFTPPPMMESLIVEETKPPFGAWQEYVEYAQANPFTGAVFTEGGYKGNHLQIAKDLRMPLYQGLDGCHPYVIAAIHYGETGLQMTNGSNGQGAFQHYSSGIRYTPNSYADDFNVQAQRTCDILRSKVGGADLSTLDDIDLIGIALARYNGCYAPAFGGYANDSMHSSNPWTLCPYTANKMNAERVGMTQCAVDGCTAVNARKSYGTMAFIAQLMAANIG
jgi:hypothetical protein